MDQAELINFVRARGLGVIASLGPGDVLSGVDLERCKAAYFEQYPDGQDRAESPEIAHIRVVPR